MRKKEKAKRGGERKMLHKGVNTGEFILYGACPFSIDEVQEIFLCRNVPALFVLLTDGSIYEQDYYIDIPGIHWFLISDGLTEKGIMNSKIATVKSIVLKATEELPPVFAYYCRKSG